MATRPFKQRYERMAGASVELLSDTGDARTYRVTAPGGEPHEVVAALIPVTGWIIESCDCGAFTFVKDARGCVHCERVRQELGTSTMAEKFDPGKHLIKVQGGRDYLTVAGRLKWFRSEHPDWGIKTFVETIDIERKYAIFRCEIYDAENRVIAAGTKYEDAKGFGDFIEKAEKGSIGRALGVAGFGTDDLEGDEDYEANVRPADAPRGQRPPQAAPKTPVKPAMPVTRPQEGDPDFEAYRSLYQASKAIIDTLGPDGKEQTGMMLDKFAFPNAALGQLTMDQMTRFHAQLVKTFAAKAEVTA